MSTNSTNINVAFVAGVRPQYIKVAAFQSAIEKFNRASNCQIRAKYVNSGQHYDDVLARAITHELGVHFDYELSHENHEPVHLLGSMIVGIHEILTGMDPQPSWVVVFGDTNTTVAAAFAAARARFRIVHVESGVRSGDLSSPEEINRRMVDHISSVHFCTSKSSAENLQKENICKDVFWTGDLGYDFFMEQSKIRPMGLGDTADLDYVLVTLHKPANLKSDKVLANLVQVLAKQARPIIFIMHPNCKRRLEELRLLFQTEKIRFLDAVPFLTMISAMKGCAYIVTDSGGIQREAYYLRKRCLLRRDSVGWSSFVEAGIHRLIGSDQASIQSGVDWIEQALAKAHYGRIDGFLREDAVDYALNTLVGLSLE